MNVLSFLGAIALTPIALTTAPFTAIPLSATPLSTNESELPNHHSQSSAAIAITPISTPSANVTRASVTGTVTYRERIALPENAIVQVQLLDVSRQDAAAIVLGNQIIDTNGGQVPFEFETLYDPALIQEGNTYVIRALITADGQPQFASTSRYAVITNGHPNRVDVQVEPMR